MYDDKITEVGKLVMAYFHDTIFVLDAIITGFELNLIRPFKSIVRWGYT
jgi:hypothetical protein